MWFRPPHSPKSDSVLHPWQVGGTVTHPVSWASNASSTLTTAFSLTPLKVIFSENKFWMPSTLGLYLPLPYPHHSHLRSSCLLSPFHLICANIFPSDLPAFILIHFTAYVLLHGISHRWSLIKYFYNHLIYLISTLSYMLHGQHLFSSLYSQYLSKLPGM